MKRPLKPLRIPSGTTSLLSPGGQRALLGLHRTVELGALWTAIQRLLESLVPHDTLVMSVNYLDWRREATTRRLTSTKSRVVDDEDTARILVEEGRTFFQPFLEAHSGIPCYRHTDIMAPERIPSTPYYQRYMTPLGWRYSAHLLFWRGPEVETSIALRRRPEEGDFTRVEMRLLRHLHDHLTVAFERVREFENERRRRRLLENFYRAKPEAVMFLNWDQSVLYASHEAMAICAAWNFGAAKARRYTPQAVFRVPDAIETACTALRPAWNEGGETAGAGTPVTRTSEVESRDRTCRAEISAQRETGGALTKPIFVVRLAASDALTLPLGMPELSAKHLRAQLTQGERTLVDLVCLGYTNKEVATQLGRTVGSVKVQLSGVFQKLHVTSRAKLILALR
jgi:DNA-binding CsgD family transcriptional regulator